MAMTMAADDAYAVRRIVAELKERDLYEIVETHCKTHHVFVREVLNTDIHIGPVVRARHAIWVHLVVEFGWSLPAVGRLFGVNHTTVMAAVHKRVGKLRLVGRK